MNLNQNLVGDAAKIMSAWPDACVDLITTSPPYWQGDAAASYETYLNSLQAVWAQCDRVLRPNGKLCVNAPLMPVPKAVIEQHTRALKNIAFNIENQIIADTDLERYSLFLAETDIR
jgi:DNA modification methylase